MSIELFNGDCLELIADLPKDSVDFVFADLPYKATSASWDSVAFDVARLWALLNDICAKSCVCVFTANFRFATQIFSSATMPFLYDLVFVKSQGMGHATAKRRPLSVHENILVFGRGPTTYNPQMRRALERPQATKRATASEAAVYGWKYLKTEWRDDGTRYPVTTLAPSLPKAERGLHPTQKPISMLEWLIQTYTNAGDTVLDPAAGSMTTAIAALRTGRNAICIEKDAEYFRVGRERVVAEQAQMRMSL